MADAASGGGASKVSLMVGVFAIVVIIINFYLMSQYVSKSQDAEQLKTSTTWITIVNAVFTFVLGAFAYVYINANPAFGQTYFIVIAHLALLLGTSAMGVSLLTKA
jgi:hypothetical protein